MYLFQSARLEPIFSFNGMRKWSQCSLCIPPESRYYFSGYGEQPLTREWVNNLITFQEINLLPSNDWSNSKVFFNSDKVCSKSKRFFKKGNVYTWLIKLQFLLEIFFLKIIWLDLKCLKQFGICLVWIKMMKIIIMQLSCPSFFIHYSIGEWNEQDGYNWEGV